MRENHSRSGVSPQNEIVSSPCLVLCVLSACSCSRPHTQENVEDPDLLRGDNKVLQRRQWCNLWKKQATHVVHVKYRLSEKKCRMTS